LIYWDSYFEVCSATRDIDKWPSRDRRTDQDKLDLIHFDLFSLCISGKIINGIKSLNKLTEKTYKNMIMSTLKNSA
jgi:hypothetical protein